MTNLKLSINKKEYEFIFGLGFLGEILDDLDISFDDLVVRYDKNPFKTVPLLVYHSAKYTLELENKEVDFTLKDIIQGIDKDGGLTDKNKAMSKFCAEFIKSLTKDIPKEESTTEKDEPVKK